MSTLMKLVSVVAIGTLGLALGVSLALRGDSNDPSTPDDWGAAHQVSDRQHLDTALQAPGRVEVAQSGAGDLSDGEADIAGQGAADSDVHRRVLADAQKQVDMLRDAASVFAATRTAVDAETALLREALLILQLRGDYTILRGDFAFEDEIPGFVLVNRSSELGEQVFRISEIEFAELARVRSILATARQAGRSDSELDEEFVSLIRTRVELTISTVNEDN